MEHIQSCPPACGGAKPATPVAFQGEAARLTYLNLSQDQSADINIVTAEGDKVTLSADYHAEATYLTYEHLAFGNSGYEAQNGALVDIGEEQNVSLAVEGELSDQELADIRALFAELEKLFKSALAGGGEGGEEEDPAGLGLYASLASVEADFEYSANLQFLELTAAHLTADTAERRQPSSLPGPASQPAVATIPTEAETQPASAPAANAAKPVQPPAATVAAEAPKPAERKDDPAAMQLAQKVLESGLRPKKILKMLKKFLRGLMHEMRASNTINGEQAARGQGILDKFFQQLEQPSTGSESKTTQVSMMQRHVSFMYQARAELTPQPQVEEAV